jgi:uncharacterized membrane protein (UPF0127 family)
MRTKLFLFSFFLFFSCGSRGEGPKGEKKEFTTILIRGVKVRAELARNEEERVLGLKYRDSLPKGTGMLFLFEEEGIYPFWMVDTKIPLDIAFIDRRGIIIDIQSMEPFSPILHQPDLPFLYALEMERGFFQEKGIKKGDTVVFLNRDEK